MQYSDAASYHWKHKPLPMPRKPFVRNYVMPKWLHRLCNAGVAALGTGLLMVYVLPLHLALATAAAVLAIVLGLDPSSLSFVEGIAGDEGYVDLGDTP